MMIGCQPEPESPEVAAKDAAKQDCMKSYGPLDFDVVTSLSWTNSSALENIPSCDAQHDILRQLADVPKADRDEWLDRQIQESQSK